MSAKETLIQYGNELKAKSNTELQKWTAQEIMGKAMMDGICYYRTPSYKMVCNMSKSGNVITVTETKIYGVPELVDGRMIETIVRETNIVLTVNL